MTTLSDSEDSRLLAEGKDRFYELVGVLMNLMAMHIAHPEEGDRIQHVVRTLLTRVTHLPPILQTTAVDMAAQGLMQLLELELGSMKAAEVLKTFDTSGMKPN